MIRKFFVLFFGFNIFIDSLLWAIDPVTALPIPKQVVFANETVSLERIDMRERYDREQTVIAYNHSTSILLLKRANRFFPVIEPILKNNGIPDDFKYLAVVESNLDLRAFSPAQAAGIWQLMPKTAEQYGLEVNDQIDERYYLEKATVAACQFLKSAYAKYHSWVTVAASYNAGMAKISGEQEKQQVDDAYDMLLSTESSRYIFRILAMKQFFENPKLFGYQLKKDDFYPFIPTKEVLVNTSVEDWTEWAKTYHLTYFQLKEFNVWLRDRKLTNVKGKEYRIQIPDTADLKFNPQHLKIHQPFWAVW